MAWLGDKLDALGTAKKRVTQRQGACQKLRSVRAATIQKCGVEEIALPMAPLPPKRKAAAATGWQRVRCSCRITPGTARIAQYVNTSQGVDFVTIREKCIIGG